MARESRLKVDITKPVDLPESVEGDCFGKLYNPKEDACSVCADSDLCCLKFGELVDDAARELEKEQGNYLDNQDFSLIDETALGIWLGVKTRTAGELLDKITVGGKVQDEVAAVEWMKRFLKQQGFKVQKGKVIK